MKHIFVSNKLSFAYAAIVLSMSVAFFMILPSDVFAARLWTSGFELQSTTAGEEWTTTTNSPSISTSVKRSGEASLRCNPTAASAYIEQVFSTNGMGEDSAYVRFYVYIASAPNAQEDIFRFGSDSFGDQVAVRINTNRTLEFWEIGLGNGQLDGDSFALELNTWYRIEMSYEVDTWTMRIDGVTIANDTSSSYENADASYIMLGCVTSTTADFYFDDVAINDANGSAQTSYPGVGSVVHALPNAQGDNDPDGARDDTCTTSSANCYQELDETDPDDATTFIDLDSTNVIGDFNMQDSSSVGINSYDIITLVDIGYRAREEISLATQFRTRIKSASGGTTSSGSIVDLGSTVWRTNANAGNDNMRNRHVSYTDPTTGIAWTPTGTNSIDNMQVGVTIADSDDVDVSALWAMVEYIDGEVPGSNEKMRARIQGSRIKIHGGRFKLQSN